MTVFQWGCVFFAVSWFIMGICSSIRPQLKIDTNILCLNFSIMWMIAFMVTK